MTILVDTNVILDILLKREPYADAARMIFTKCAEMADYIVTRNMNDYRHSRIKAIEPDEFLRRLQDCHVVH